MLIISNKSIPEFLRRINDFDLEVVKKIARAAVDCLANGSELNKHVDWTTSSVDEVHKIIEIVILLYRECYITENCMERFVKFFETCELKSEYVAAIIEEFRAKKIQIDEHVESDGLLYYHDMQWRFEAKVASRSLLNQMAPLVSIDLKFGDSGDAARATRIEHTILQTDPTTVARIADSLEKALNATHSRRVRKMQKQMKKLVSEL